MAKPPDLSFWLLFGSRKNEKREEKKYPKQTGKLQGKKF